MTPPLGAPVSAQDAVQSALIADDDFRAYLRSTANDADPRVYEVLAPSGTELYDATTAPPTPWPYATVRGPSAGALDTYGARAFDVTVIVTVWVPGTLERLAKVGAEHVRRILDGAPLVLADYRTVSVRVGDLLALTDPDQQATQARYPVQIHAEAL